VEVQENGHTVPGTELENGPNQQSFNSRQGNGIEDEHLELPGAGYTALPLEDEDEENSETEGLGESISGPSAHKEDGLPQTNLTQEEVQQITGAMRSSVYSFNPENTG
jgi:hypothetical protein